MLTALLLLAQPIPSPASPAAAFGAPCVCFPLVHAGPSLPEDPLGQAGWSPTKLVDESLRILATADDACLRAETLRRALLALDTRGGDAQREARAQAQRGLVVQLRSQLERETQLAPLSRATLDLGAELEAARTRLLALGGVASVERHPGKSALIAWFDARQIDAQALAEAAHASAAPSVAPPNARPQALAGLALAFAGRALEQLGSRSEIDSFALARAAAAAQPADGSVQLVAGLVLFDGDTAGSAQLAREALRLAAGDARLGQNLLGTFGHFFGAQTLEELGPKLEQRAARR